MNIKKINTRKLVLMALLISFSFSGSNIKIFGTIALDSMPAYLGTLILGPIFGAIIGATGHLLTATTSGFPLGIPAHIVIMIDMAMTMYLFGATFKYFSKKHKSSALYIAVLVAIIINGPIGVLMVVPILGIQFLAIPTIIILSSVALLNLALAFTIYVYIPKKFLMKLAD